MSLHRTAQTGFTLIEMIIVMVLTGIIGGIVAIFLQAPMKQYIDVARRAELTDIADGAFQRLSRDIRTAVPNSIRLPTPLGATYVEFIPTKNGGRYRGILDTRGTATAKCGGTVAEDVLDFATIDTCFEIIGAPISVAVGDSIVIGSTQSDGSLPYLDVAAASAVRRVIATSSANAATVHFASTVALPPSAMLDSQRFQTVEGTQNAVTYACVGTLNTLSASGDGQAQLIRYWNYGFNSAQVLPTLGSSAILANNVSACAFDYDVANGRNALLAVKLSVTKSQETVSLYEEIHVNNAP